MTTLKGAATMPNEAHAAATKPQVRRLTRNDLRLFATIAERDTTDPTFRNELPASERRTARRLADFGLVVNGTSEGGRRIYYFDPGMACETMLRYAISAAHRLRVDFSPKASTLEAIERRLRVGALPPYVEAALEAYKQAIIDRATEGK